MKGTKSVSISMPVETLGKLNQLAFDTRRTRSSIIDEAIERYIDIERYFNESIEHQEQEATNNGK